MCVCKCVCVHLIFFFGLWSLSICLLDLTTFFSSLLFPAISSLSVSLSLSLHSWLLLWGFSGCIFPVFLAPSNAIFSLSTFDFHRVSCPLHREQQEKGGRVKKKKKNSVYQTSLSDLQLLFISIHLSSPSLSPWYSCQNVEAVCYQIWPSASFPQRQAIEHLLNPISLYNWKYSNFWNNGSLISGRGRKSRLPVSSMNYMNRLKTPRYVVYMPPEHSWMHTHIHSTKPCTFTYNIYYIPAKCLTHLQACPNFWLVLYMQTKRLIHSCFCDQCNGI